MLRISDWINIAWLFLVTSINLKLFANKKLFLNKWIFKKALRKKKQQRQDKDFFHTYENWRYFISKPLLQEILKKVLQAEGK